MVLALAARCASLSEIREVLRGWLGADEGRLELDGGVPLANAGDVPAAETWLLRSLIKPNEGFMSRHVERRLSLAMTRRLVTTSITPNAMTLISVAIGLSGAPFFLSSRPSLQLTGALLFLTHSILDGCDGEIARLKFLESRAGAVLDFWGDNLVHGAIFTAIAVGWALAMGAWWPLLLGGVAVVSTGLVALVVWRRGVLAWAMDEHAPPRARIMATFVHRDFIYVILALSAFGKAGWFVIVTAIGAPLFLGILAWLGRARPGV
jgi:phosphatidylglycerophosphate synthase